MKKSLVLLAILSFFGAAKAQDESNMLTTRATSLTREYLRPSLTRIYLVDGSSNAMAGVKAMEDVAQKNMKFDINLIESRIFQMNAIPENANKAQRDLHVKATAEKIIREKKIGNQVMKVWFPEFINGSYSVEKLLQRGQYAATDNDVLKQNASARQSLMYELGEKLIDRSYVIFYFVQDKTRNNDPQVSYIPYVYKLDFNELVRTNFYNNYFNVKDGIDQCEFPLKFITNAHDGEIKTISNFSEDDDEEIFTRIRKVADFQAKVPIIATHPVRAKIGIKEGVKKGKRYVAMENKQMENGSIISRRIATLRAGSVADNDKRATGDSQDLSSFFYIKGSPVHEGMTLVENPDFGTSIEAQYNLSEISATLALRISGTKGSFIYLKAGMVNNEDGKMMKVHAVTKGDKNNYKEENVNVLKAGLGLGCELNFGRMFCFTPCIGGGILWPLGAQKLNIEGGSVTVEDKTSVESYYVEGAVRLGYYMTRNIQIFGEIGYNLYLLGDEFKYMRDWYSKEENIEAKDPMAIRLGGGIKICF
ncbi:MAG: hypothetical protein J5529_09950 [Prevotella sp.]|nr:hypothetical protein [Prevotella sp.]